MRGTCFGKSAFVVGGSGWTVADSELSGGRKPFLRKGTHGASNGLECTTDPVDARSDHDPVNGASAIPRSLGSGGALLVVNDVLNFMQEHRAAGVVETLRRRLQVRCARSARFELAGAGNSDISSHECGRLRLLLTSVPSPVLPKKSRGRCAGDGCSSDLRANATEEGQKQKRASGNDRHQHGPPDE